LAQFYDVTIIAVRPGTHPQALAILEHSLRGDPSLLACWYSDVGAVNRIMIIRNVADAVATLESRTAALASSNPFGVGEFIVGMAMDIYTSLDIVAPLQPGAYGPVFEVRTYELQPGVVPRIVEGWRKAVPARLTLSPLLAVMTSVTGAVTRMLHVWPYKSFDERARLRQKAITDGVWPPAGGPSLLISQQVDIYLPAAFSPTK
jgi:hypothetical protein